jgi:ParB family chromosome partitioning protein
MAGPTTVDVVGVRVADIRIGERLRPIDPVWAEALGRIMLTEGQKTPIEICRMPGKTGFLLVAGGHRRDGAELVGMEFLEARIVSAEAMERRQREVSENIWRKDLGPIDRAAFVAEMVDLRRIAAGLDPAQSGQAIAAQARWSETIGTEADDAIATIAIAYGWTTDVAEALGFSRRTIYNDLELHRGLKPDVADQIRTTGIATNAAQLRALAKLEETEQRQVAAMIVGGDAKSVTEAVAMRDQKPRKADADPQDVHYQRLIALWSRMDPKHKRLAFAEVFARDPKLPAELKALLAPLKEARADG